MESSGSFGLGCIVASTAQSQRLSCLGEAFAPDLDGLWIEAPDVGGLDEAELLTHDSSMQKGCDTFWAHPPLVRSTTLQWADARRFR